MASRLTQTGVRRGFATLLLLVAVSARAQLVGECPAGQIAVTQDGLWKGCGVLDLPAADFTCNPTPLGLVCSLNTAVSHLGSCLGDVVGEHCTIDDARGVDFLLTLVTFDEGAAPATPASGKLRVAAENTTPNRLIVVNDAGQIQRVGVQTWTVTIGSLAADNTTRYFVPAGTNVTPDTLETNVDTFIAPANLHLWALACGSSVPPGAAKSRTFTARSGAQGALVASSISCSWLGTGTATCTSRGSSEAGTAVTAGQAITISAAATGTPTATVAAETICVLYWNLDAF